MEVLTPNRLKYLLQKLKTQIPPKVQQYIDWGNNSPASFTTIGAAVCSVAIPPGYYIVFGTVRIDSDYNDMINVYINPSSRALSNGENGAYVCSYNGIKCGQYLQVFASLNINEDYPYINLNVVKNDSTIRVDIGTCILSATRIG